MKWFIALVLVCLLAGGVYLATQPRLDAVCVVEQLYDKASRSPHRWACIHYAAARGAEHAVAASLDDGVSADLATESGATPLMLAAQHGRNDIVQRLLRAGADTDQTDQALGWTALHWATRGEHPAVVRALITAGASPRVPDNKGRTPLFVAAESDTATDTQIAHTLVAGGAQPTRRDHAANTALLLAAEHGNVSMTRYLLELKANANAHNRQGMTPLFAAIDNNHADIVRLLLAAGAAPDANVRGVAPLARALENNDSTIEHLLRANGAADYRLFAVNAALLRGDNALVLQAYDQALAAYDEAISLAPDSAPGYAARARAELATGRPNAARADLRRAVALDSAESEYPLALARLQLGAGHPAAAVQTLTNALVELPDNRAIEQLLATIKSQLPPGNAPDVAGPAQSKPAADTAPASPDAPR